MYLIKSFLLAVTLILFPLGYHFKIIDSSLSPMPPIQLPTTTFATNLTFRHAAYTRQLRAFHALYFFDHPKFRLKVYGENVNITYDFLNRDATTFTSRLANHLSLDLNTSVALGEAEQYSRTGMAYWPLFNISVCMIDTASLAVCDEIAVAPRVDPTHARTMLLAEHHRANLCAKAVFDYREQAHSMPTWSKVSTRKKESYILPRLAKFQEIVFGVTAMSITDLHEIFWTFNRDLQALIELEPQTVSTTYAFDEMY